MAVKKKKESVKKEKPKVEKKEDLYEKKIKEIDDMLADVSNILGYHLERIEMLESEQESLLNKLSLACNRLGI